MSVNALAEQTSIKSDIEVLIVEDSVHLRRLMGIWLENLGYKVQLASNGREALEVLARSKISLVISDWMMPGMDGIELCREIRKNPQDHYIYIILMTARSFQADFIEALNAGADDFAPKPLYHDHLVVRLRAACRVIELERGLKAQHDRAKELYQQMENELEAAAKLQIELLPFDRKYGSIDVRSLLVPTSFISGDCQNHFPLPGGRVLAYQADIAGHGIRAALLSVTLQRVLTPSFCCWKNGEVLKAEQIVDRLNDRLLSKTDTPEYFTMFLTIVDPASGHVSYCQAGHPKPVLLHSQGAIEWIGDGGFPVGMLSEADFEEGTCQIAPGDRLMIFSDGVTECPAPSGELLGSHRLTEILNMLSMEKEAIGTNVEVQILEHLKAWHGSDLFPDDVSMLSIYAVKEK